MIIAVLMCAVATLVTAGSARAGWIENHVLSDEVRIEIDVSGKAVVEHRLVLKTNGTIRLREYRLVGIDRDATPLPNSYVVPERDALSMSLQAATPVSMKVVYPKDDDDALQLTALDITVEDRKGLRRGTYVFVLRYRTDLRARGLVQPDGALVRVVWHGPRFDDGFDNARTTFVVPASPSPPRSLEDNASGEDEAEELPPTYLSEVRRGSEHDEIELLRTYAPKGERVRWGIRVDPRAVAAPPKMRAPAQVEPLPIWEEIAPRDVLIVVAGALWLLVFLLVWLRGREVSRLAEEAVSVVPPALPMPPWLRGLLAATAFVGGLVLQLLSFKPLEGACCVVAACILAAHGVAMRRTDTAKRGPGRWLAVTEREALGKLPRRRGALLDISTRAGKLLFVLMLGGWGAAAYWFSLRSMSSALLVGFDAVLLLAIFGTGTLASMPPDMSVEPARFLRRLVARLRKNKGLEGARFVPRIRIPNGAVDPDELRLLVVPRIPLRGFTAIEVGLTYAVGMGARVAMPEVLLRVVSGSPCDAAVATVSRSARITPGRKPDERVISFAPRLPTVRMTAEITAALAMRIVDRDAVRRSNRAKIDAASEAPAAETQEMPASDVRAA